MLKSIVINKNHKIRLVWKYPMILSLSMLLYFYIFGYMAIYGSWLFFSSKSGKPYSFDYINESLAQSGFMDIIFQISLIITILYFSKYIDRFSLKDIGLARKASEVKKFILGTLIAGIFILIPFIIFYILGMVKVEGLYWNVFPKEDSISYILIFDSILLLLVAFQEELLSRAYFIQNMITSKPKVAVFVSSLIFSLIHLINPGIDFINEFATSFLGMTNIFIIGIIYGYYYIKTKDLWFVIGAHFSWNFIMGSVLGLPISGDITKGIIVTNVVGNKLYTGGTFGPEGGIVVTISLIAMFLLVRNLLKHRYI